MTGALVPRLRGDDLRLHGNDTHLAIASNSSVVSTKMEIQYCYEFVWISAFAEMTGALAPRLRGDDIHLPVISTEVEIQRDT